MKRTTVKRSISRNQAVMLSTRCAQEAWQAGGGPAALAWSDCLLVDQIESRAHALACMIEKRERPFALTGPQLYQLATRTEVDAPVYNDTPLCLRMAINVFLGAYLSLRPYICEER